MEPLRDTKEGTAKKTVNPQMMVRTDFKEQKLEKFFLESNKPVIDKEQVRKVDTSLAEEEYEKNHKLFLKGVENLEDEIMDCSENNVVLVDDGKSILNNL